jgi:glycosyltransferase involved in cell wall biosynthesis
MNQRIEPLVSVIMPMKDAAEYVFDAVTSVLKQTYQNFELIIVDDGSVDESRQIVTSIEDSRIRVIDGPCTGLSGAFNTALNIANGEYICNCDADDLFPDKRIEQQVEWLEKHGDYAAICGAFSTMDQRGKVLSQFLLDSSAMDISEELLSGKTRTSFCTFLVKKETLVSLGGYRDFFVTSPDIDLQFRMAHDFSIWYEPENTYFYRLHDTSMTHSQVSNKRVFFEETAKNFLEQRKQGQQDDLELGRPPSVPSFEVKASSSQHQIVGILTSEAWRLHRQGLKWQAIKKGAFICYKSPFSLAAWKTLLVLMVK